MNLLERSGARVCLLTNFIPPYRLPIYSELSRRCDDMLVLLSTAADWNRRWSPSWGDLRVVLQRTITLRGWWKHPTGFKETIPIYVPFDTIPHLFRFRPNILISGEMGFRTLQAALYRYIRNDSRLIIWATISDHTELGRGRIRDYLRRRLLEVASAVIVNGHGGARYLGNLGVEQGKIFHAPYTTDLDPFLAIPETRRPEVRLRLLYIGALIERKGLLPFLSALVKRAIACPHQNLQMDFVGEGQLASEILLLERPANLRLRLLGPVAYSQLPSVYSEYGILVFPTLADEWGMVVTEAMASGLPILGSLYSQAVEELVSDGENGWTFYPDEPDGIEHALNRALNATPDTLAEMSLHARSRVRSLTPSVVAEIMMSAVEYARRKSN